MKTIDILLKLAQEKLSRIEGRILGVEVGVQKGETACRLLDAIPNLYLFLVDAYLWNISPSDIKTTSQKMHEEYMLQAFDALSDPAYCSRRRFVRLDSWAAALLFRNQLAFDFIYLDANHSYEAVLEDLAAYWPLLNERGLMCGDDYNGRMERLGSRRFGVARAVNEFASKNNLTVKRKKLVWWFE